METKVIAGQSLLDIAIQTGGSVEAVFDLALSNNLSITEEMEAGLVIDTSGIKANDIAGYYQVKDIRPGTYTDTQLPSLSGIGYMIIEETFIIADDK